MNVTDGKAFKHEAPGLYAGVPTDVYHAAPGLSKSLASVMRRSPRDYVRITEGLLTIPPSASMELGSSYHAMILEGVQDYHVHPEHYWAKPVKAGEQSVQKPWNANANSCKEWLAGHSDKPVYSPTEAGEIIKVSGYVRTHPFVAPILATPGLVEVSMFARESEFGYLLKGRADKVWFEGGKIFFADLKKTTDASTAAVGREILNRRYHVQAAWYRYIAQRLGHECGGFALIFFEDGRSPKCNPRWLSSRAIDEGEKQMRSDLELYHRCRLARTWPEWADAEERMGYVDLPEYIYGDEALDFAA